MYIIPIPVSSLFSNLEFHIMGIYPLGSEGTIAVTKDNYAGQILGQEEIIKPQMFLPVIRMSSSCNVAHNIKL